MKVRGLVWIGVDTPNYAEILSFFRALGDPPIVFEGADSTEFEFPNGTRAQVTRSTGRASVVPLIEIEDDIASAREELKSVLGLVVGDIATDGAWQWLVVVAPDGQRFEVGRRMVES